MQCDCAYSFPKQVQRPKEGKGKTPGPGEYRLKPDLDPQFNSSKLTSPRISFPIAPKDQCEKVGVLSIIQAFCRVVVQVFSQLVVSVFIQVLAPVSDRSFIQLLTDSVNQHVLHRRIPRQGNTVPRQHTSSSGQGGTASCSAPATKSLSATRRC